MDRVKQIWYLSPMRAAKVQASLRIRAVSPEPSLLAHISSETRGTFRQKARSLAPLNGWACAVKICHDGMLEDTNSLDGAQITSTGEFKGLKIVNWAKKSFITACCMNYIYLIAGGCCSVLFTVYHIYSATVIIYHLVLWYQFMSFIVGKHVHAAHKLAYSQTALLKFLEGKHDSFNFIIKKLTQIL